MATLGWQAVYRLLSGHSEFALERFFSENADGSIESPVSYDHGHQLSSFPLVAVGLTFEFDILALAELLNRAKIPPKREDDPDWPMVLAGGPLAFLNPAPAEPGVDVFFVGEAEAGLVEVLTAVKVAWFLGKTKKETLDRIKDLPGVYVPGMSKLPVRRQIALGPCSTLEEPAYSAFISAKAEFGDALLLEINRGCPHGCRFCAAGYIYRPPRQAAFSDLTRIVEQVEPAKVGLMGTALTDWEDLGKFLEFLHARRIKFSLSSLRADRLTEDFLHFLRHTGARSLTFALEGMSQRLRSAMNKNLDETAFLQSVEWASRFQFNHLKIYLIVGWPGENEDDLTAFSNFLDLVEQAMAKGRGKKGQGLGHLTVSASCLVPKPWTPLQWMIMATEEELKSVLSQVKRLVSKRKGFRFTSENPFLSRLQGLLARGDRRVFDLVLLAMKNKGHWKKALRDWPQDPAWYLDRIRDKDEVFPWEVIDTGVSRDYLYGEWQKFQAGSPSLPCPGECGPCKRCGVQGHIENLSE